MFMNKNFTNMPVKKKKCLTRRYKNNRNYSNLSSFRMGDEFPN